MIKNVVIQSFKSLQSVGIDLTPLTLFVGPNGCGKSTVLVAVDSLCRLGRDPQPHEVFKDALAVERVCTKPDSREVVLNLKTEQGIALKVTARPKGQDSKLELVRPGRMIWESVDATNKSVLEELGSFVRLRLDPDKIKKPAIRNGNVARLEYDGSGLAATIADLIGSRDDATVQAIERDLASIVPACRRLRVIPADVERPRTDVIRIGEQAQNFERREIVPGHLVQLEMSGVGWLDADLLSEGTLIVLALLTVLHGPARPQLLLLDDIDRGLHPSAQIDLVACLRQLQRLDARLQIIATTHSPYLLDRMDPSEVRVMGLKAGRSTCKKLTEHPDWEKWKDSIRAGEFWGSVGEDWVTA
ncbi:MAG TPA: AAA family ATPase [Polyangiaceae bacterium]|nr:AAA family ATPase [Polyangiaceae bacterium]